MKWWSGIRMLGVALILFGAWSAGWGFQHVGDGITVENHNLAQRATVLARDADRMGALFGETRSIDDQHAAAFGQHVEKPPPDPVGIPVGVRDEMLKRLGTMLQFRFNADHEVDANDVDREILARAAILISNDTAWNRADDRSCPSGAKTWSIYCAGEQATMDVTGGIHHRRPAMEVVRALVDERSDGRNYSHRLMDYNNELRTQLSDVRTLFAQALERISAR